MFLTLTFQVINNTRVSVSMYGIVEKAYVFDPNRYGLNLSLNRFFSFLYVLFITPNCILWNANFVELDKKIPGQKMGTEVK